MRHFVGLPSDALGLRWSGCLAGALTICLALSLFSLLVPARSRDVASRIPRASTTGASTGSRDLHLAGCDLPLPLIQTASLEDRERMVDAAGDSPASDVAGPSAARTSLGRLTDAGPVLAVVRERVPAAVASLPRGRAPPPSA